MTKPLSWCVCGTAGEHPKTPICEKMILRPDVELCDECHFPAPHHSPTCTARPPNVPRPFKVNLKARPTYAR